MGKTPKHKRICCVCQEEFEGAAHQIYCSYKCKSKSLKIRDWGLSKGTVGAIQELKVAVDLLSKGYEVFRAESPACSCDLVVLKNNKVYRVEVRTGYRNRHGTLLYSKDRIKADYTAVVVLDEIVYIPSL